MMDLSREEVTIMSELSIGVAMAVTISVWALIVPRRTRVSAISDLSLLFFSPLLLKEISSSSLHFSHNCFSLQLTDPDLAALASIRRSDLSKSEKTSVGFLRPKFMFPNLGDFAGAGILKNPLVLLRQSLCCLRFLV